MRFIQKSIRCSFTKITSLQLSYKRVLCNPHTTSSIKYSADGMNANCDGDLADLEKIVASVEGDKGDTVLVTGGNGFLGQHVISQLHQRAHHIKEIRVLDLWPYVKKLDFQENKPVTILTGSITCLDTVHRAMKDVSSVIHIAGLVSYGTFPDIKGMEEVNVNGTLNVVRACLQQNVQRLIHCSTVDVVIGFKPICGGTEDTTPIPKQFLFPGYPESKLRAEQLVLAANEQLCSNGEKLLTVALRANVMYGELDPYYVLGCLKTANLAGGKLIRIGNGQALFQQCYAGNIAAAFVQTDAALTKNKKLAGQIFYVPDNTPLQNSFYFMEPFLKSRGFILSQISIPYGIAYGLFYMIEMILKALSPLVKINLKVASCSIRYINTDLYFSSDKAKTMFNYQPVFSTNEAIQRSIAYYKTIKL